MKYLKGSDLVEYISERQAKQVRRLSQARGIQPKLAIVSTNPDNLAIQKYMRLKQARGAELGIEVDIYPVDQSDAPKTLKELAKDSSLQGIILQLPLLDPTRTEELTALIPPEKDVDGLTENSLVEPATVGAILWLLAGYNIEPKGKNILIIGQGKLVGTPLANNLLSQGIKAVTLDDSSSAGELREALGDADIVVSAAGSPGLLKTEFLHNGQVIIDAGTTEDEGTIKGDLDPSVYESDLDIKVTPKIGGLGPLTIAYLFENLIQLIDKNS